MGHYNTCQTTGEKVISSQAFTDRTLKVSVDRAKINHDDPSRTKILPTDGIVELQAGTVRSVANICKNDTNGNLLRSQTLLVTPDPIKGDPEMPDNPAHALIYASPDYDNRNIFKKVIEALALIATVKIPPMN